MKGNKKNRKSSGSGSVGVGIVSFLLGFIFAFIVLIGSIFGVGYVAVTSPMDDVLGIFGLNNKNENYDETDPNSDKYNYINSDQAPNILALIKEVMGMANEGLGGISLNKIDALAPITDTVLDMVYVYIDEVVDFDKECFKNVSLVSILDTLTTSVNYIQTSKLFSLINQNTGNALDGVSNISAANYLINGVEAQYATVAGMGDDFRLPVLFDYYVSDGAGNYYRTVAVNGISPYPDGLSTDYITETLSKDPDAETLYKVYYVPCKKSGTSITEAEYILKPLYKTNENVSYKDENGNTRYLNYTFRTIEYGADTVFVAVKPQVDEKGKETFVIDPNAIDEYYADYAKNYHKGVEPHSKNNELYGVFTINGINYFKDNQGNVIDYDPLTVSDLMLDPTEPLNNLAVNDLLNDVVGEGNADIINEIFSGISLGNVLRQEIDFDQIIKDIKISTFLNGVKPDDTVMAFIVYNLSNVTNDGGTYTAIYDKGGENIPVTVEVDADGTIKSIKDGSGKVLKGNTVADLSTLANNLTLDIFFEVTADNTVMLYVSYGVSDVVEVVGQEWQYEGTYGEGVNAKPVRIYTDENNVITKVTDLNGDDVKGTTINEVNDRINGIMNVISIPDLMDINPEENIMAYIGYGIYDVTAQAGTHNGKNYSYVGTYKEGGTEKPVYISTKTVGTKTVITSVWKEDGVEVKGTKANDVGNLINGVDEVFRITDFVDIYATNAIMTYVGYGVYGVEVGADTNNGKAYTYTGKYEKAGVETAVYIATDSSNIITSVWDASGETVSGTKISELSDRISSLQNKLTIGDIITVNSSSSAILQALKDTTINGLNDRISTLKVGEIVKITDSSPAILQALKDTTIDSLSADVNNITIGAALGVTDSSPSILQAIQNYTLGNLSDNINNITIKDALGVTDSSPSILQAIQNYTLGNLSSNINNITIKDALGVTDSSPKILQAIQNYTLGNLADNIENLKIGDILATDGNTSKIMLTLIAKDATIGNIDTVIKTLTVSDVLEENEINSNGILIQLADKNIFSLAEEMDNVLIQRIYVANVYNGVSENSDPTDNTTYNPEYLYYEKTMVDGVAKFEITKVGCTGLTGDAYDNAVGKLTQEQFNAGNGKYYTYGQATGIWKLILYRADENGNKTEKAYTLNNFNVMVENCAEIVNNATLAELKEAGIAEVTDDQLGKYMTITVGGVPMYMTINESGSPVPVADASQAMTIGEFSLNQLLKVVFTYMVG